MFDGTPPENIRTAVESGTVFVTHRAKHSVANAMGFVVRDHPDLVVTVLHTVQQAFGCGGPVSLSAFRVFPISRIGACTVKEIVSIDDFSGNSSGNSYDEFCKNRPRNSDWAVLDISCTENTNVKHPLPLARSQPVPGDVLHSFTPLFEEPLIGDALAERPTPVCWEYRTGNVVNINDGVIVWDTKPLRLGNSGGPVLNEQGEAVGIISAGSNENVLLVSIEQVRWPQ